VKKTIVLHIDPADPDKALISRAAKILRDGGLVAFPTETVYGLGADLSNKKAIERLDKVKARPKGKHYTVHIASVSTIKKLGCAISGPSRSLMARYWPGPLTLILKGPGGQTIGFRMPDNVTALSLIRKAAVPVAAPSANISGELPPTTGDAVLKQLDGRIDILLDAGETERGVESTVIDMTVTPPKILRQGAIAEKELSKIIYE
jgi:L-threonylcarbamoyladenylate synthase